MNLWSNGGSTGANNPDNQFSITFGSAKAPRASELTRKRKVACNPNLIRVHSGHIRVSSAFLSVFFKNNR